MNKTNTKSKVKTGPVDVVGVGSINAYAHEDGRMWYGAANPVGVIFHPRTAEDKENYQIVRLYGTDAEIIQ